MIMQLEPFGCPLLAECQSLQTATIAACQFLPASY